MNVTYTRQDLIYQALDNLNLLQPGQAPSDEDVGGIDKIVDALMQKLAGLDIVYVADFGQPGPTGGEIEASYFLPLAAVLADAVKSAKGMKGDPDLAVLADQAVADLRTLTRPARTLRTLETDPVLNRNRRVAYNPILGR